MLHDSCSSSPIPATTSSSPAPANPNSGRGPTNYGPGVGWWWEGGEGKRGEFTGFRGMDVGGGSLAVGSGSDGRRGGGGTAEAVGSEAGRGPV